MARPLRIEYPGAWYLVISRRKRGKTSFRAIQCPSPNYSCKTPRSIILANLSHLRSFNSSTIISNNLSKIIRKKFQSNTAFECGDLKKGFGVSTTLRLPARIRCPDCHHEFLLAFSCRRRWFLSLLSVAYLSLMSCQESRPVWRDSPGKYPLFASPSAICFQYVCRQSIWDKSA